MYRLKPKANVINFARTIQNHPGVSRLLYTPLTGPKIKDPAIHVEIIIPQL